MTLGSRNSITAIAQYTQLWLGTKYKKKHISQFDHSCLLARD